MRIAFVLGLVAACGGAAETTLGPRFGTTLRASNEVVAPTVQTGTGSAGLTVNGQLISYGIVGLNLSGTGNGQLHLGPAGADGPVVVGQLFVQDPNTPRSRSRGSFQQRDIQATAPGGAPMTIEELVVQMRAGNVYVNVITDENPAGEIRGQLALAAEAAAQSSSFSSSASALQIVPE
jgi:hypothetical protein